MNNLEWLCDNAPRVIPNAEKYKLESNSEGVSHTEDSREKLEADVWKNYSYTVTTLMYPPSANKNTDMLKALPVDTVIGWLDRQAAIDRKEFETILEEIQECMRNGSR